MSQQPKRLGQAIETPCVCSCWLCRPRQQAGDTRQERKAKEDFDALPLTSDDVDRWVGFADEDRLEAAFALSAMGATLDNNRRMTHAPRPLQS